MKTLADNMKMNNEEPENDYDINGLLSKGKKIITIMGASKSGTSCILTNVAKII